MAVSSTLRNALCGPFKQTHSVSAGYVVKATGWQGMQLPLTAENIGKVAKYAKENKRSITFFFKTPWENTHCTIAVLHPDDPEFEGKFQKSVRE